MFSDQRIRVGFTALIAVFLLPALPSLAKVDPQNVMGMWLFNEGAGGTATDSSANGNDGEIHGAQWVNGKFGKALEFDGTDNWVEVPHSDTVSFKAGTSFTITFYFKGSKVGGSLVGKNYEDQSQATPWYLIWDDGSKNTVTLYLRDSDSNSFRADGMTPIADEEWHFIAGRADADTGKISIWVDGEMEAEADFNTDDGYGTSEGVLHFGRHHDRYTAGILDDVALFNIALDTEEMDAIMENGVETAAAIQLDDKLASTWGRLKQQR